VHGVGVSGIGCVEASDVDVSCGASNVDVRGVDVSGVDVGGVNLDIGSDVDGTVVNGDVGCVDVSNGIDVGGCGPCRVFGVESHLFL